MKKRKKIIILAAGFIIVVTGVLLINLMANSKKEQNKQSDDEKDHHAPSKKEQEKLHYIAKWIMKYDKDHNLVSGEVIFPEADEPSQGLYYQYDSKGNRVKCKVEDYAYDDANSTETYTYENGELATKTVFGTTYEFLYADENYVLAQPIDSDGLYEDLRYELTDDGKVTAIIEMDADKEDEGFTYCNCDYDGKGNIKSLSYSWDSTMPEKKEVYTYEYDLNGRYSNICYESYNSLGKVEKSMIAQFVYEQSSDDFVVYTYNDLEKLTGSYMYKYNKKGDLKEVLMYETEEVFDENETAKYRWGTTGSRVEYNYPGGEVPDEFFEIP